MIIIVLYTFTALIVELCYKVMVLLHHRRAWLSADGIKQEPINLM